MLTRVARGRHTSAASGPSPCRSRSHREPCLSSSPSFGGGRQIGPACSFDFGLGAFPHVTIGMAPCLLFCTSRLLWISTPPLDFLAKAQSHRFPSGLGSCCFGLASALVLVSLRHSAMETSTPETKATSCARSSDGTNPSRKGGLSRRVPKR